MKMTKDQRTTLEQALRKSVGPSRIARFESALHTVFGDSPPIKVNSTTVSNYFRRIGETNGHVAVFESPLDRIRSFEQQIHSAIRELDDERNKLQERIKQIDDTVAKYKKI